MDVQVRECGGMAQAYGNDLRRKVLEAYAGGKGTMKELGERFGVSYGWVRKIVAAQRRTGRMERVPQVRNGPVGRVDPEQVRQMLQRKPDAVLHELQAELRQAGTSVSVPQLWRVVERLGLRLKKSRSTRPSATPQPTASIARSSSRRSRRSRPKT